MKDVRNRRGFYWFNGSLYFTFEKFFGVIGRNNRISGEPIGFHVAWNSSPKSMTEPGRFTQRYHAHEISFGIRSRAISLNGRSFQWPR